MRLPRRSIRPPGTYRVCCSYLPPRVRAAATQRRCYRYWGHYKRKRPHERERCRYVEAKDRSAENKHSHDAQSCRRPMPAASARASGDFRAYSKRSGIVPGDAHKAPVPERPPNELARAKRRSARAARRRAPGEQHARRHNSPARTLCARSDSTTRFCRQTPPCSAIHQAEPARQ